MNVRATKQTIVSKSVRSKKRSKIHDRNTRKKDELNLSKCRLKIGQRSFAFRGAKSYNDLPDDIKKTRDTKHFKKNLYNYLLKL